MTPERFTVKPGFYNLGRLPVSTERRPVDSSGTPILVRSFNGLQEAIQTYYSSKQFSSEKPKAVTLDGLENVSPQYRKFLVHFGYDTDRTQVFHLHEFLLVRTQFPDGTEVAEVMRHFENNPEAMAVATHVSVDSIMVTSGGQTHMLVEPFRERDLGSTFGGVFVTYSPVALWEPRVLTDGSLSNMDVPALGAGAAAKNPFVAAEFFHERRHLDQKRSLNIAQQYANEIDASESALSVLAMLRQQRIDLMPYATHEQTAQQLESYLLTYARKFFPWRSRLFRLQHKI